MKIVPLSILAALLAGAILTGCSNWVYKADIQQGNMIDDDAVAKISVGMNKRQVLFVLGSPAVKDPFHATRWDYVYYLKPGRGEPETKTLAIYFEGDEVVRLERHAPNAEADQS